MQFLVNVLDATGTLATDDEMQAIHAFNRDLKAGGHLVLAVGLEAPGESTVVDGRGAEPLRTDGPFVETKEFVAGLWIFEAADRDEALALAAAGSRACNRRLEVRGII